MIEKAQNFDTRAVSVGYSTQSNAAMATQKVTVKAKRENINLNSIKVAVEPTTTPAIASVSLMDGTTELESKDSSEATAGVFTFDRLPTMNVDTSKTFTVAVKLKGTGTAGVSGANVTARITEINANRITVRNRDTNR